jgi:Fur family transcriptional regulator, ferric uptake regulator
MNKTKEWLDCLLENGYRLTAPRRAVVETVSTSTHVLSPLEIFELARERYPKLGLVTVYRTLDKLEELDLVQRVHRPSDCQAFVAAFTGHQHLLICQDCGRVEFFSGDDQIGTLMTDVSNRSGYKVEDHWLQLFGLCAECQG